MPDSDCPVIVWFRDDLRLADHPALCEASATGKKILCVYILDEKSKGIRPLGGAARWWLHGALAALRRQLKAKGGALLTFEGEAPEIFDQLVRQTKADSVFCHHRYQKPEREQDDIIAARLKERHVTLFRAHGTLLRAPDAVMTKSGTSFQVFGAYWKAACALGDVPAPRRVPSHLSFYDPAPLTSLPQLDEAKLLPTKPDWAEGLRQNWEPGAEEGEELLHDFVAHALHRYDRGRNEMAADGSSRLSPYLRFGHVSPRQVWAAASKVPGADTGVFLSEIGWREFAWYTLYHQPELTSCNLKSRFDVLEWRRSTADLQAWQQGRTGIPIVDAGMRQLWQTGWMHNRARMIIGSFLVKHLLLDWKQGEAWFWDTLVDADPANNAMNWQWVAGTGIEATPFFRIFNPLLQAEKFDPHGDYVRRWVPELARLSDKAIRAPWNETEETLRQAKVKLGGNYPKPIVDLQQGRERALAAFRKTKSSEAAELEA